MKQRIFTSLVLIVALSGCASLESRKSLENVAKQWCETIRASQILCSYPMTEDLVPGDVFLVQTTIQEQSSLYLKHGFLALDDRQVRLKADYKPDYFDGYWKDSYGNTPHAKPVFSATSNLDIEAPRVAFPSYTFDASSSSGLSLALPINGILLGLGYLHAEKVTGNVMLSNAYTYAADSGRLYDALKEWARANQVKLAMTLRQSGLDVMFLRVVSRVYLVGGVNVTLLNSANNGAQAAANGGGAPDLPAADGSDMAAKLNAQADSIHQALPASGGIKFLSASSAAVSLAESFDRPLVVGYLGFDVPVFSGGVLGVPIPVFERLEGRMSGKAYPAADVSPDMASYNLQLYAFQALAGKNPAQALAVAKNVAQKLASPEFRDTLQAIGKAETNQSLTRDALAKFTAASDRYVSVGGKSGPRYASYTEVFSAAFDNRDMPIGSGK